MRALRVHKYTPNGPLKLDNVPEPTAGPNEACLRQSR